MLLRTVAFTLTVITSFYLFSFVKLPGTPSWKDRKPLEGVTPPSRAAHFCLEVLAALSLIEAAPVFLQIRPSLNPCLQAFLAIEEAFTFLLERTTAVSCLLDSPSSSPVVVALAAVHVVAWQS